MLRYSAALIMALAAALFTQCAGGDIREDEPKEGGLTIAFAGDVLLDRGLRPIVERDGAESIFDGVREQFGKADYVVANLECPLSDTASPISKKYIFRAGRVCAQGLRRAGITHCAMANNHTVDQGFSGLRSTSQSLIEAGIEPIGYMDSADLQRAPQPAIISKDGISVAVMSVCCMPIENYSNMAGSPGICIAYAGEICQAIREIKESSPGTYVVLFLHWGNEFQKSPSMRQRIDAMRMAEAGADVIVGCHPHVVQNVESIGGCKVYFSIGNFAFDQRSPDSRKALMPVVYFGRDTIAHRAVDIDIVGNKPVARAR